MIARIDERTKRMDSSIDSLWVVASETKDKVTKMEGAEIGKRTGESEEDINSLKLKVSNIQTRIAPLYAAAAFILASVVGFVTDLFKGQAGG
ncbi:MAG: hypothetical protein B7Z37_23285 [Verrucomicrobia bacterium 12-59-8]|nr:MAG: hypothetical protein B7Z37_23285 [Verrucomicrobia bacterium 12-59-8]